VNRQAQPDSTAPAEHEDPTFRPTPRYWVQMEAVEKELANWDRKWLIGVKDVTATTNERTAIFSFLPRVGVGHTVPIALLHAAPTTSHVSCFVGSLNSLTFDYVARQKVGGTHLTFNVLNQLPVLPPQTYNRADTEFITSRVIDLVYTAWDIKPFADDVWRGADENLRDLIRRQWEENKAATGGHEWNPPEWADIAEDGIPLPPFKWDEERRAQIRAELDAYYALLYGLTRDELRYILDPKDVYGPDFPGETFRVLKEKEEKRFGEYRTRRLVLEAYDRLAKDFELRRASEKGVIPADEAQPRKASEG